MSNYPKDSLKQLQYERRKQVCEWLAMNEGWRTAPEIGRGIGINNDSIRTYIDWLMRKGLLRKESRVNPRKMVVYCLALSLEEIAFDLESELEEGEKAKSNFDLDDEHLAWMAKYRKQFVMRRQMMNLDVPNFSTEC